MDSCWGCGSPIHSFESCPERRIYADQVNGFDGNNFGLQEHSQYYEPELDSYFDHQQYGKEHFNEYDREPCANCGSMEHYADICQSWNGFSGHVEQYQDEFDKESSFEERMGRLKEIYSGFEEEEQETGQEQKSDPFDYSSDEPEKDKLDLMMEMMREILKDIEELQSEENQDVSSEYGEDEPINEVSISYVGNIGTNNVESLSQLIDKLVEDANYENRDEIIETVLEVDVFKPKETSVGVNTTSCPLVLVKPVRMRKMIQRGPLYVKLWEVGNKEKFNSPLSVVKNQVLLENSDTTVGLNNVTLKQLRNVMVNVRKRKERDKRRRGGGSTQMGATSQISDSKAKIMTYSFLMDKIVLEPPRVKMKLKDKDFGKGGPRVFKVKGMVILCQVLQQGWYCMILRLEVVRLALRSPMEGIT